MYIYQLCDIAQMVEMNAHGIAGFYQTLKNVSVAGYGFGKEWAVWLFHATIALVKRLKENILAQFQAYFVRKDLSKDELQH